VKKLVGHNLWILKCIQRICHTGPERPWSWDPTLGLIIDVRAPQATFPAAALSRVWVLRFVYLVFPIRLYNDHKYSSPPSTKTSRDKWLLLGAWVYRSRVTGDGWCWSVFKSRSELCMLNIPFPCSSLDSWPVLIWGNPWYKDWKTRYCWLVLRTYDQKWSLCTSPKFCK